MEVERVPSNNFCKKVTIWLNNSIYKNKHTATRNRSSSNMKYTANGPSGIIQCNTL